MTKTTRRQQILEILAKELETKPNIKITTANLATAVNVSEAALYRHFASKAQMFEALIDFAESSVFSLINTILENEKDVVVRCERIIQLVLGFAQKNPGITCVLVGNVLLGEDKRLQIRVVNFFDKLDTQIKQVLREANLSTGIRPINNIEAVSNLITTYIKGKLSIFVSSSFAKKTTTYLDEQWTIIKPGLFR